MATRTQIYLTEEQRRQLDERAQRESRTLAELIREAVDQYLATGPDLAEALAATFGAVPDFALPDGRDRG